MMKNKSLSSLFFLTFLFISFSSNAAGLADVLVANAERWIDDVLNVLMLIISIHMALISIRWILYFIFPSRYPFQTNQPSRPNGRRR